MHPVVIGDEVRGKLKPPTLEIRSELKIVRKYLFTKYCHDKGKHDELVQESLVKAGTRLLNLTLNSEIKQKK